MPKIILITGGTSGLGEAMANALANNGNIVYATGRNIEGKTDSEFLRYMRLDVTQQESISSALYDILEAHNKIDMLINNAGIGIAAPIEEIPIQEIKEAFDINLFGSIQMIQSIVPIMRKNKNGLIINISSIAGKVGLPFQGVYSSTKFAVEAVTEALSIELKPFGINVCLIEPGDYKTNVNINRKEVRPSPASPYAPRLSHFFHLINKNIEKGRHPKKLANLVVRISKKKNPKLRYRSGNIVERITPFVHFITPTRIFSKALEIFYKL